MKLSQNILIGALFFGALSMLGFFTVISEEGPFASKGKEIVVFFDNADGIKVGSSVTVIGVRGGIVSSIDLVEVDKNRKMVGFNTTESVSQRVAVTLELKKELIFYENYTIDIKNASLLGGKVISVNPGSAIEQIEQIEQKGTEKKKISDIRKNDDITGNEDVLINKRIQVLYFSVGGFSRSALEQLIERRSEKSFVELQGKSSGDPIAGLAELISENRENVRKTIQNIRDITSKINKGQGTLGQLINDDELHRNASTLVDDAQVVARELRESLEDQREQAPVNSFIRAMLTAF